jgi:UDP-N-acetylmuramate: L-alanyl-gamma-D-glutamyl-meso-diaminopimelate ligase
MVQSNNKHIHVLGVAGTFMANLAVLAKQLGYKVTGTDINVYPPMSDLLEQEQIHYIKSYDLEHNKEYLDAADCIVIGNALSRGNPCVEYVLDYKKLFKSGPAWLAENILYHKWVLAVSGTHGKTTTTSMVSHILESNHLNPGFLIGGKANNFTDYARVTDSNYFVIEADEYDTAFFDKRPKFLHYFPNTLIINNIEFDHADIYSDLTAIEQQFGYLLRTVPKKNGFIIAPDELCEKLMSDSEITRKYGLTNTDNLKAQVQFFAVVTNKDDLANEKYQGKLLAYLKYEDGSEFDCYFNNKLVGTLCWNTLGLHNVNNALAAILAAASVGVAISDAIKALMTFKGVARRLEKKAVIQENIIIFDDFAHHPTAIKTTLDGAKKHYKNSEFHVVVDFSSYSMRSGAHKDEEIVEALAEAEHVYLYQASYVKSDLAVLLHKLQQTNPHKKYYLSLEPLELIELLANNVQPNSIVLFMTKSDFNQNINKLVDKLNMRYSECKIMSI